MEPSCRCESSRQPYPVHHHHHHHHHHHPMIFCPHHQHQHQHHTVLCPIHHHQHHHTILCPLHHHHHLITCHSYVSPTLAPLPLQNHSNLQSTTEQNEAHHSGTLMLQEQDYEGLQQVAEEDEDEDEPIFVLTDEWREFFAKSEAKRKLEKKQAKKKQKN